MSWFLVMMTIDRYEHFADIDFLSFCAAAFGVERVQAVVHIRYDRKHEVCIFCMP